MAKLTVFNLVTLDGHFTGKDGDISWHVVDQEFQQYAEKNSNSGNVLLFGRITYELMKSYWTSSEALKNDPVVAHGMNNSKKIVFSKTIEKADWQNTTLLKTNLTEEVAALKKESKSDITILGSGSIVSQLTEAKLIDEYHMLIIPVIIGEGKSMFSGVMGKVNLKLINSHNFSNGSTLLCYELN